MFARADVWKPLPFFSYSEDQPQIIQGCCQTAHRWGLLPAEANGLEDRVTGRPAGRLRSRTHLALLADLLLVSTVIFQASKSLGLFRFSVLDVSAFLRSIEAGLSAGARALAGLVGLDDALGLDVGVLVHWVSGLAGGVSLRERDGVSRKLTGLTRAEVQLPADQWLGSGRRR